MKDGRERKRAPGGRATLVPGIRLLRAVVVLVGLAALAPLVPGMATLWMVAAAVVLGCAVVDFARRPRIRDLEVDVELPTVVHVGRDQVARLTVRWVPDDGCGVRAVLATRPPRPACSGDPWTVSVDLAPHEVRTFEVPFVPVRRGEAAWPAVGVGLVRVGLVGRHRLRPRPDDTRRDGLVSRLVDAVTGLVEARADREVDATVRCAPGRPAGETSQLLEHATELLADGERIARRDRGGAWSVAGLREFVPGDDVRRVDWKASARRMVPIVRELEAERDAETLLALDVGRVMGAPIEGVPKFELAATAVLDVAAVALRAGDRVGLLIYDSEPRSYVPAANDGMRQLDRMREAFAGLDQERGREATDHLRGLQAIESARVRGQGGGRRLAVVFSDFTDEISARELVRSLAAAGRRQQVVFVAVGDPHVRAILERPTHDVAGLFERSVAGSLIRERRRVLETIRRMGIEVLDGEPADLTAPLIGRFLALRRGTVAH